ncbi:MAG: hypothetical protein F4X98_05095 [Gammaproteobacteria bacterium]|nr:hypothetical protein [Gammaproteobacteria bacterium]
MAARTDVAQAKNDAEPKTAWLTGCRPVRVTRDQIVNYEGRYEYWDAETEIAWEVREPSSRHEEPCIRIVELVADIAKMRGRPIAMFGHAALQEWDAHGGWLRSAQPDASIYLDRPGYVPQYFVLLSPTPQPDFAPPDVVVEVDLTTDIRDRKLGLYASYRIPELWIEVPEAAMPSKRKRPGLTILAFEDGGYRQCAESVAFPGWSANEIHAALNEPNRSQMTVDVLRRVGKAMGQLAGSGPDNDPFLATDRRITRHAALREGREEGHREGREEGRREGRLEERLSVVERLLAMRNISVTSRLEDEADRIAATPHEAMLQAAVDCSDVDDFIRRLGAVP